MKIQLSFLLIFLSILSFSQKKNAVKYKKSTKKIVVVKSPDLRKINDSVTSLIPQKLNGKFGFIDQKGNVIIQHQYSNVGFFTEDCNLLNAPNEKLRKFGANNYASVRLNDIDYRIDRNGKRRYTYKKTDLGVCKSAFKQQLFHAYILNEKYGIIEDSKFENPGDYRQFTIYPQYEYLHILEGDDLKNPMIIALKDGKFGVIDIHQNIIIPFQYADIKRNFSWKLARLFEVTQDVSNYFFVDINNHSF